MWTEFHSSKLYSWSVLIYEDILPLFIHSHRSTNLIWNEHYWYYLSATVRININMRVIIILVLIQQLQKKWEHLQRCKLISQLGKTKSFPLIPSEKRLKFQFSLPFPASPSSPVFEAPLCVESLSNAPFLFMTNTLKGNYLDMARLISAEWARASGHTKSQTHSESKRNINTTIECILLNNGWSGC